MTSKQRLAGVLLHPTSLPGGHGVGDLGPQARKFVDWLYESGQSFWQILPLGPPAAGNSPYSAYSTFAGNRVMVSFDDLVADGFVNGDGMDWLKPLPKENADAVDYDNVLLKKAAALDKVAERFVARPKSNPEFQSFLKFCEVNDAEWLDDFALYEELKEVFDQEAWWTWEKSFRDRIPSVLKEFRQRHANQIMRVSDCLKSHEAVFMRLLGPSLTRRRASVSLLLTKQIKACQFFFWYQWTKLHAYANSKGIKIIGDIPIFVSGDSCDVWANRDLVRMSKGVCRLCPFFRFLILHDAFMCSQFRLDENGRQLVVAGVPPDYFSETGQLWGNVSVLSRSLVSILSFLNLQFPPFLLFLHSLFTNGKLIWQTTSNGGARESVPRWKPSTLSVSTISVDLNRTGKLLRPRKPRLMANGFRLRDMSCSSLCWMISECCRSLPRTWGRSRLKWWVAFS